MGRTWTFLTLLTADYLGRGLSHTECETVCDCGDLLEELFVLRRKSAADDARIVKLESRLARARMFVPPGELGIKAVCHEGCPACFPPCCFCWPCSTY
jgi:hypothetical protein